MVRWLEHLMVFWHLSPWAPKQQQPTPELNSKNQLNRSKKNNQNSSFLYLLLIQHFLTIPLIFAKGHHRHGPCMLLRKIFQDLWHLRTITSASHTTRGHNLELEILPRLQQLFQLSSAAPRSPGRWVRHLELSGQRQANLAL